MEARYLNYSSTKQLLKSTVKHPSDYSKNGDVGHAWIYLEGLNSQNQRICIEGGHSGELGAVQPKYFEGVMNLIEFGYPNPSQEQKKYPCHDPNPIRYMWNTLRDGYFERGSGGHFPNCAVRVELTKEQFLTILKFIQDYNFKDYSLRNKQCCTFLRDIANLVGIQFDIEVNVPVEQTISLFGHKYHLWNDPAYSMITISSPEKLQISLERLVKEGKGTDYLQDWKKKRGCRRIDWQAIQKLPKRLIRYLSI